MEIKNLHKSINMKRAIVIICSVVLLLTVFQMGMHVGFRKASFSYRFGESYYRAFDKDFNNKKEGRGSMLGFPGGSLQGGHGAVGKIISVNLPTFIVEGADNLEKVVIMDMNTEIRKFRDSASTTDLKIDDYVVVLGTPNELGQVSAKLIRLLPPPKKEVSTTSKQIN